MKLNLIANMNGSMIGLSFGPESEVVVGREIGCSIAPLTADGLSRRHAKFLFKDGAWTVEDMGSTNGTFKNGEKLSAPATIAAKDKLHFGRFELLVDDIVSAEAQPADAAQPAAPAPTPAPAPAPAPAEPAPAPAPVADLPPVDDIPDLPSVEAAPAPAADAPKPASPLAPAKPVIRKPVVGGGVKPGLKLPPKPGLGAGLKLPPKPGLGAGLKLPPKPGGFKLPPKP